MKTVKVLAWIAVPCLIIASWALAIWADRTYWEPARQAAAGHR